MPITRLAVNEQLIIFVFLPNNPKAPPAIFAVFELNLQFLTTVFTANDELYLLPIPAPPVEA